MAYDSSKRGGPSGSGGNKGGGGKPAGGPPRGNGGGSRGGGRPAPQKAAGEKPSFNLQQFDPAIEGDEKSWFVGAGWPIRNKQSGDDTGGISLIVELSKCQVMQDKEGNDIVRINLWPRKEQTES